MNSYSVYEHVNKQNGKRYIGITSRKPECRWGNSGSNYTGSPKFYSAISQCGWDSFDHNIIASGLSKEEACAMEIELIAKYNTMNEGYNISSGGDCAPMSQETKDKLSKALVGNKNGLGKPCSPEKAKKISDAQKGKKLSEEHKHHLSIAKTGKSHASPSIDTCIKISNSHKKRSVYCYETNEVYESVQQCARALNLDATAVCAVCKGKHSYVKGYHIQYATLI